MRRTNLRSLFVLAASGAALCLLSACPVTKPSTGFGDGGGGSSASGLNGAGGAHLGAGGFSAAGGGSGSSGPTVDPTTCAEAAASKSYVGCDFWPTVVDNVVYGLFDYAVVVANTGDVAANVVVERGGKPVGSTTVAPNGLGTLYLPWVEDLKSTQSIGACLPTNVKTNTVLATGGAYHLTSSVPVTVYQFNALEYKGAGGYQGKDWSACTNPSNFECTTNGCFSFSNDASLLTPSTAMTGTYRVTGESSWLSMNQDGTTGFEYPPYIAVTATTNGTNVTVNLSSTASVTTGSGVTGAGPGGSVTFTLNAGDVAELVGGSGSDLSGSLVKASAPVQVIAGISCSYMPHDADACDHMETNVFPAETLGKHYFVTRPTGPHAKSVPQIVRIYGNVDGTTLTYAGVNPGGPATIDAGQWVELDNVTQDFEISGDHEFAVGTFMLGASIVDPMTPVPNQEGDPSASLAVAVEQYRTKYVFLAPADYDESYVDVVQPIGAKVLVDGIDVSSVVQATALSSGFGVSRVPLGPGKGGAHTLTATKPVGIQVIGYGAYTSYQYPGGLNLGQISPPPPK